MAAYGFDRIILFLKQKGRASQYIFFFIGFILVADLYITHRHLNPLTESNFYQYYHPSLKPVFEDKDDFRIYFHDEFSVPTFVKDTVLNRHIRGQMFLIPNLGILHGIHQVTGTSPLELRYQYVISEILMKKSWKEKIRFLKLANVKYIITSYRLDRDPELKGQVERLNPFLFRINGFLPRAWIVGNLIPVDKGTGEELIDGSFDPFTSALAKGDVADQYNKPSFEKISRIDYADNSKIHIELTAEKPGILVLSESSYPGWRVFVDGKEEPCLWLNLLFQGVEVDEGKHQIDFVFRPEYFGISLTVSLFSLMTFFILWFCLRLSEKRLSQQKDK
jgi:hypothetical protein